MCGAFCVMYDAVIVLALLGESTVWSYAGAFKLVPYTRLRQRPCGLGLPVGQ